MNCARCGGTITSEGRDAYYHYWRCVDCGNTFRTPIK